MRSPDGFPLNLQNPHSGLAADVHVSLRTFGGGSAFIDEDHNGAGSTGERFAAPTGMNERLAGCASANIANDAEPPQLADGLRGPTSLSPSVLTLTCLDPWRECQVLAECRDRNGTPHQGLLPNLSAGSTTVHSASAIQRQSR